MQWQSIQWEAFIKKFLRFLSGGGAVWAFRAGFTAAMTELAILDPVVAYRVGLAISFVLYFVVNRYFIFQVHDQFWWRLAKYSCVSFSFLAADGLLMQALHQGLGWHYLPALCTSTAILLLVKFFIYNRFVFQKSHSP